MVSASAPVIAALASAAGPGAIAVIRLSGSGSHDLLAPLLDPPGPYAPRQIQHATLRDESKNILDDVMAVFFKAPKSFTGEDSVEIYCHGGAYIVQRILAALYARGARPAEPGEFTRRAFLNGKMDLTQAEGIKELIDAQSHQQWLAARQLADGKLHEQIDGLRVSLIEAMAYLEARIDFPDEGDTADVELSDVRQRVEKVYARVQALGATYQSGRVASQGLMVALLGAPNAGKSTLMNTLLGRERAIVTPLAGTTRDYLEERCLVQGRLIRLVDTAGVRETTEVVEKLGVEASRRLAAEADVLLVLMASDGEERDQKDIERWLAGAGLKNTVLRVRTKSDLTRRSPAAADLEISCQTGSGIEALQERLAKIVDEHVQGLAREAVFVTSARHLHALNSAARSIEDFFGLLKQHSDVGVATYDEILAFELQNAAKALAAIVGAVDHEDILDKVFSEFCVGK